MKSSYEPPKATAVRLMNEGPLLEHSDQNRKDVPKLYDEVTNGDGTQYSRRRTIWDTGE